MAKKITPKNATERKQATSAVKAKPAQADPQTQGTKASSVAAPKKVAVKPVAALAKGAPKKAAPVKPAVAQATSRKPAAPKSVSKPVPAKSFSAKSVAKKTVTAAVKSIKVPLPKATAKPAPRKEAPKAPAAVKKAPSAKATPVKAAPAKPVVAKAAAPKPQTAHSPKAAPAAAPKKIASKVETAAKSKSTKAKPEATKAKPEVKGSRTGVVSAFADSIQKLAARRVEPKNTKPSPRGTTSSAIAGKNPIDSFQPAGLYSGIQVTQEFKPFPEKTPYSQPELDKLQEALIEERERLLSQLTSLSGVGMDALVNSKENAGYSVHIAEHATDLQTAEANMGVRSIEEERLEQVDQALERIKHNVNHYGLCMACGNKIGIQRLIARPHAHLCMPCRKRYETIRSRRGY